MMRHNDIKTAFIATSLCFFSAYSANALEMKEIGNFKIGDGEGYAEMLRYHAQSKSLMVTASETGTLERLSIQTPSNITRMEAIDLSGGDVTAVAVHGNLVAASIKADAADAAGTAAAVAGPVITGSRQAGRAGPAKSKGASTRRRAN